MLIFYSRFSVILHNIPPLDEKILKNGVNKILDLPSIPISKKSLPIKIIRLNKNYGNNSKNYFELVRVIFQNQFTQQPFINSFNTNLLLLTGIVVL